MIFGRLPLREAEGAILAHAIEAGPLGLIKKGTLLTAEILAALKAENVTEVLAARLEKTDIAEDEAADTLAKAFKGAHVKAEAPFTGRANLIADADGCHFPSTGGSTWGSKATR